jgi:hypothetical protein
MADFDEAYATEMLGPPPTQYAPTTENMFLGSYVPVTPPGQNGPFLTNTYFLRGDRKSELTGTTTKRSCQ